LSSNQKKLIIFSIVFIGIVELYFMFGAAKEHYQKKASNKEYININTLKNIPFTNMEDTFDYIKDRNNCLTVISALATDIRYINIILEDVPKSKSIDEYYIANKGAISDIYGLTSLEEFKNFYDTIAPLQVLNKYEMSVETINNSSDKYNFELKLEGNEDVTIPVVINVKDLKNMKSSSFWNKR
jgi:hypothetical protein